MKQRVLNDLEETGEDMRKIAIGLLLFALYFFTGCMAESNNKAAEQTVLKENEYRIYCLNKEGTKLTYYIHKAETVTQEEIIKELLSLLADDSDALEYQCAIEESIALQDIKIVKERLYVYFSKEYYNIDPIKEVLVRAAIVKTLAQVEGVERVVFYIDGKEQKNSKGAVVGSMTASDFVDDTTDIVMDNNKTNIILYFTDEQGTELYAESREIYIDTVSSKEKIVLNQLLEGPQSEYLRKVLPEGLTIISVVTRDGVCYLDMDETFLTGTINVIDTIPVYAIVNSLVAIDGVDEVQILINGEAGKTYRGVISFDAPLTAREDLIAQNRR